MRARAVTAVLYLLLLLVLVLTGGTLFCYWYISWASDKYIFTSLEELPEVKTGIILGTSSHLASGGRNPYFTNRIRAAAALYRAGKIRYIIASGDNSMLSYNEPKRMRAELIRLGVPEDVIYLDYAGFRTLDSVVRGKLVFGQHEFTIISQRFHNERAVYISRNMGIKAYAFDAVDVRGIQGLKTHLREYLARVKAVLDVKVINAQPKFLGKRIQVGE